ncbi:MAG: IS110 family transposase [Roseburia hominis]
MNYITVYVGMDVHKETFTFCAYTIDAEKGSRFQRTEADYKNVLRYLKYSYRYGNDANFICGYEAGCLGYTLYHQLTEHHVNCVILAPTTMLEQRSKKELRLISVMLKSSPNVWRSITTVLFTSLQQRIQETKEFTV